MKGPTSADTSQPPDDSPIAATGAGKGARQRLQRLLARIVMRWWGRRMLECLAVGAAVALLLVIALCSIMILERFDPAVVQSARQIAYVGLPLLLVLFVLPLLIKRLSLMGAARHAEANGLGRDALLVSAAELLRRRPADPKQTGGAIEPGSLEQVLLERAADEAENSKLLARIEYPRARRAAMAIFAILLVGLLSVLIGPVPVRHALALLSAPDKDPSVENPFQLQVRPGDLQTVEGADQAIIAQSNGFAPRQVELMLRRHGDTVWRSIAMNRGNAHRPSDAAPGEADTASTDTSLLEPKARFEALLFNLDKGFDYYAKSGAIESTRHSIEVTPRPKIARIDLLYRFPKHTGRPPLLVQNEAEIRGLRGSEVEIRVLLEGPLFGADKVPPNTADQAANEVGVNAAVQDAPVGTSTGEIVIDGERRLALRPVGAELHTTLTLNTDGRYRVELPFGPNRGQARLIPVSAEHGIVVLDDLLPVISVKSPGRDTKVTSIEEIEIALEAEDDVALREVELIVNINGSPQERHVRIDIDDKAPQRALGKHLLALEDLALAPGDLISYYVRASDALNDPARTVSSDIFFLDVRPFERRFRAADGGGGSGRGGGGQGGADSDLTAQQRSVVVALFNLRRDASGLADEERRERAGTLEQAQGRIKERVDAIARRLGARQFMDSNDAYRILAEQLPLASDEMLKTQTMLGAGDTSGALPTARAALLHLQRADAAFRDVRVAMSRNSNGRGGAQQNDLANLFRLELDKFRSRYQNQQHAQPQSTQQQQVDDTLRKLRELARRQQQELERAALRGDQPQSGVSSQKILAADVERLVRELERLTRQRDSTGADTEALERAAQSLRRAQQAMNEAETGSSTQAAQAALDRLREARRQLDDQQESGRLGKGIADAQRRTQESIEEQRKILQELKQALARNDLSESTLTRLGADKLELADTLRQIAADINTLRSKTPPGQPHIPEVAQALDEAARAMGDKQLAEEMRRSAQAMLDDARAHAQEGEVEMKARMEAVRDALRQAAVALTDGRKTEIAARHEALQALIRGMDTDRRRLARGLRQAGQSQEGSAVRSDDRAQPSATARTDERAQDARGRSGQNARRQGDGARGQQSGGQANADGGGSAAGSSGAGAASRGGRSNGIGNEAAQGGGWASGPANGIADGRFTGRTDGNVGTDFSVFTDITTQILQRMRSLQSLRDSFDELRAAAGNVDGVIDAIETLDQDATHPRLQHLAAEHEALLAELKRLEAALRDPNSRTPNSTVARNQAKVSPPYESMVEAYFRALSDPQNP